MDLGDLLSNPAILGQLASQAGVGDAEARTGLEALLPAITRGLERNAGTRDGREALTKALGSGGHDRYLDSPDLLGSPQGRLDGNAILGHVFGSKDVSRNVAGQAAQSTGLDSSVVKKMLPIVASLAMAALSKNSQRGADLPQASDGGADLLGSLLSGLAGAGAGGGRRPQRGSDLDDVLDLVKSFF